MTDDQDELRSTGRVDHYRMELESLSREELIERVMRAEGRLAEETFAAKRQPTATRSFDVEWRPREYVRLPAGDVDEAETVWRIALISIDLTHPVIGIELAGDVTVGRAGAGSMPDLDLTDYSADSYGVSRLHAMLRPTPAGVQVADLGSTNGTLVNGEEMRAHTFHPLADKDRVRFGNLEFQFRLAAESE